MFKHPDYKDIDAYICTTLEVGELPQVIRDIYFESRKNKRINPASEELYVQRGQDVTNKLIPFLKRVGIRRLGLESKTGTLALVAPIGHHQVLRISLEDKEDRYDLSGLPIALKPVRSFKIGGFYADVFPEVKTTGITETQALACYKIAEMFGYYFWDCAPRNVGLLADGLPVIIDPGAVVPYHALNDQAKFSKLVDSRGWRFLDLKAAASPQEKRVNALDPRETLAAYYDHFCGSDGGLAEAIERTKNCSPHVDMAFDRHPLSAPFENIASILDDKRDLIYLYDNASNKKAHFQERYQIAREKLHNYYLGEQQKHMAEQGLEYGKIKGAMTDKHLQNFVARRLHAPLSEISIDKARNKSRIVDAIVRGGLDEDGLHLAITKHTEERPWYSRLTQSIQGPHFRQKLEKARQEDATELAPRKK